MSTATHHEHAPDELVHGHDDHHHHHDDGMPHVSLKGYMTGFILSVILTAIPFWLVMAKVIPDNKITTIVILGFAVVQVIVHIGDRYHAVARFGQCLGDARLVLVAPFLQAQKRRNLGQRVLDPMIDLVAQKGIAVQQCIGRIQNFLNLEVRGMFRPQHLAQFDLAHHQPGHDL